MLKFIFFLKWLRQKHKNHWTWFWKTNFVICNFFSDCIFWIYTQNFVFLSKERTGGAIHFTAKMYFCIIFWLIRIVYCLFPIFWILYWFKDSSFFLRWIFPLRVSSSNSACARPMPSHACPTWNNVNFNVPFLMKWEHLLLDLSQLYFTEDRMPRLRPWIPNFKPNIRVSFWVITSFLKFPKFDFNIIFCNFRKVWNRTNSKFFVSLEIPVFDPVLWTSTPKPSKTGFFDPKTGNYFWTIFASSNRPDISEKLLNFENRTIPKFAKSKSSKNSVFSRSSLSDKAKLLC